MPYYDTRVDLSDALADMVEDRTRNGQVEQPCVYVSLHQSDLRRLDAGAFWEMYEHPALLALANEIAGMPVFQPLNFDAEPLQEGCRVDIYPGRIPIKRTITYHPVDNTIGIHYMVALRHQPPVRARGERDA